MTWNTRLEKYSSTMVSGISAWKVIIALIADFAMKMGAREGKVGVTKWIRGKQTYYKAYIYVNHKRVNIGNFHTEEEARKARRNAEIKALTYQITQR